MLSDECQRSDSPNAPDVTGIVAATHDAYIDELFHGNVQLSQQHLAPSPHHTAATACVRLQHHAGR